MDISSYKHWCMDSRIDYCRKVVFVGTFFLCATVLSRFTQDQSLTIRHTIWALSALLLFKCEIPKTPILICFVGYFVLAVMSLMWALNPVKSLYEISKIFLMITFFCVACDMIKNHEEFFLRGIVVLSTLLSVYGFLEILTGYSVTCKGTMPIRNLWASSQVLLLPLCVYSIKKWRIALIPSVLIVVNLVLLMNRASLLALFVSGAIFICYKKRLAIIGLLIIVVLACAFNRNFLSTDSLKSRMGVWTATAKLAQENPFFGIGIDNWEIEVPKYSKYFLEKDIAKELHYFRPHNDYFWVLSEIGIFGLIFYAAIFGLGLKKGNLLALCGLAAYMTIAFFSFPKERAFHSMILIVYLAYTVDAERLKMPSWSRYAVMIVLCFVVAEFALCHKSERHIRRMQIARDRKQWKDVLAHAKKISPVRTLDIVNLPIKWYTGEAHYYLGNKMQAIIDSARAFELNPNNILVLDRMGDLYSGLGDKVAAVGCYKRALSIKPDYERVINKLKDIENVNDGE